MKQDSIYGFYFLFCLVVILFIFNLYQTKIIKMHESKIIRLENITSYIIYNKSQYVMNNNDIEFLNDAENKAKIKQYDLATSKENRNK